MGRPREGEAVPGEHRGLLLRGIGSRPLTSYFVMTFALSWTWFGLALGAWELPRYRRETAADGPWPQAISPAR